MLDNVCPIKNDHGSCTSVQHTGEETLRLPISEYQKRFFVEWVMAPDESTYNVSLVYKITGALNLDALILACEAFISRNRNVSAVYEPDGTVAYYRNLTVYDYVRELPAAASRNALQQIRQLLDTPFDLTRDVLLRLYLLDYCTPQQQEYYFIVSSHHIIGDALSAMQIALQIQEVYNAVMRGQPPVFTPCTSFEKAVALEQQQMNVSWKAAAAQFWTDFTGDLPLTVNLPYSHNSTASLEARRADKTGNFVFFELTPAQTAQLKAYAREKKTTVFMVLSAVYGLVLSRYSNQESLLISYPINMRPRGCQDAIGGFVNNVPLKIEPGKADTLDDLLLQLAGQRRAVKEYQGYSLTDMIQDQRKYRQAAIRHFFNAGIVQANLNALSLQLEGLEVSPVAISNSDKIVYEIGLLYDEYSAESIKFKLEYRKALFDKEFIEELLISFKQVLKELMTGKEVCMATAALLPQGFADKVLYDWNGTEVRYHTMTLSDYCVAGMSREPQRIAVTDVYGSYTHEQIQGWSYHVAGCLYGQQQVAPGSLVGILCEKGYLQVVGTLGILRAGAAYLPLHVEWPVARMDEVLAEGEVNTVLVSQTIYESLIEGQPVAQHYRWLVIEELVLSLPDVEEMDLPVAEVQDIAYVIFTSGSTGKPKGVAITHQGAVNTLQAVNSRFQVNRDDRVLALSELSFDLSVYDIFGVLGAGGTVVFPEQQRTREPEHWLQLIQQHGVTIWNTVPQLMQLLADYATEKKAALSSLKVALLSGDWIPVKLPAQLKAMHPAITVMSLGGATEGSIWSVWYEVQQVQPHWHAIPYGIAMPNQKMYVLNRLLDHCPAGVTGEICIGGEGVALGYWNDRARTREKFIHHPTLGRLYRTGDQGKWNRAGYMEFEGRTDDQVKIRGYRVEPGEIEQALNRIPGIQQSCVLVKEKKGGRYLVAYYVCNQEHYNVTQDDLEEILSQLLPEYMVPAVWMALEAFPLTANGKLNRQALPEPDTEGITDAYTAPVSVYETAVCAIWQEVLGVTRVGITDDFFRLGGDSISSIQASHKMTLAIGRTVRVADIFQHKTIEQVLLHTAGASWQAISALGQQQAVLSFAQERLWFIEKYEGGTNAYHMPAVFELQPQTDVQALITAIQQVVQRHAVLRTCITETLPGGGAVQQVKDKPLAVHTVTVAAADELNRLLKAHSNDPFDLAMDYPLRVTLFTLQQQPALPHHYLAVCFHHIASDGWSMGVFEREVLAGYQALVQGQTVVQLPLPDIQYADYAVWQRSWLGGEVLHKQVNYWKNKLAGFQQLNLPADYIRPGRVDYQGGSQSFVVNAAVSRQLRALAQYYGVTMHTVLLSALHILLGRYSGQQDIVTGSPVANRHHRQTEALIGFFVNTLVNRTVLSNTRSFTDLLMQVHHDQVQAQLYQDLPFEILVDELGIERDASRHPVFQVMFGVQQAPPVITPEQQHPLYLRSCNTELWYQVEKFDLSVFIDDSGESLQGLVSYAAGLFGPDTIHRFITHYQQLLAALVQSPGTPYSQLPLLTPAETQQIEQVWNGAVMPATTQTLPHICVAGMQQAPERIAVTDATGSYTHQQLYDYSFAVAAYLYTKGYAQPGRLIGILSEKGYQQVAGTLGIMWSGAAYLPLHWNWPSLRTDEVLTEGKVDTVLVSQAAYEQKIKDRPVERCYRWLIIEELLQQAPHIQPQQLPEITALQIAYVIFTSGSTGKPKGVTISHEGAVNTIRAVNQRFQTGAEDKVLALSELSFDLSVYDLFGMLAAGGTIVFPDQLRTKEPEHWHQLVVQHGVTVWNTVPQLMQLLCGYAQQRPEQLAALRLVLLSGDWIPLKLPAQVKTLKNDITFMSLGGATEGSIWSVWYEVQEVMPWWNAVPYGLAMPNQQLYVLDSRGQHCAQGVKGEIFIGGTGVAVGYWNDEVRTRERFIQHPSLGRLYKTGDLGKWNKRGYIEFEGRNDEQVKLRGYRVETGEVEQVLLQQPGIRQCCVQVREKSTAAGVTQYLCAWYLCNSGHNNVTAATLAARLAQQLPEYMVPAAWMAVEAFPLTANGKLDKQALPDPDIQEQQEAYAPPVTDTEEKICAVWQQVLGLDRVGIHENFFRLGGDSISSIRAAGLLRQAGYHCQVRNIFEAKTIAVLARQLNQATGGPALQTEQGLLTGVSELLPAQQWFLHQVAEGQFTQPHHWNQSVLIKVPPLDTAALRAALPTLLAHHDALRGRLINGPEWQLEYQPAVTVPELHLLDVNTCTEQVIQQTLTGWQNHFNWQEGAVCSVGYLYGYADGSARVFMALHHLVTDAVSWRVLVEDLYRIYEGRPLPAKGSSSRQWQLQLQQYAAAHSAEAAWWQQQLPEPSVTGCAISLQPVTTLRMQLEEELTRSLLHYAPQAYHTQVNELLLTALAYALRETNQQSVQHITLEGHGREELHPAMDISRTVGWFTSFYPVALPLQGDIRQSILYNKEYLRHIPGKGIGFGALAAAGQQGLSWQQLPPVYFNYFGQLEQTNGPWSLVMEESGTAVHPGNEGPGLIHCNGMVQAGCLAFTISTRLGLAVTEKLVHSFQLHLTRVIHHCEQQFQAAGAYFTPGDFPAVNISQPLLDKLMQQAAQAQNNITHIYPATSLQQGFIYHVLSQAEDDAYRLQLLWDYNEALDLPRYIQAWQYCLAQYPVLRTAFNWEEEIIQVIYQLGTLRYEVHDISHLTTQEEKETAIRAIQEADRKVSFRLGEPTLFRLHIIQQTAHCYTVIKTAHHSITEGWSEPLLLAAVHRYYQQGTANTPLVVQEDRAYLQAQEYLHTHKTAVQAYWQTALEGVEEANDINPLLSRPIEAATYKQVEQAAATVLTISGEEYYAVKAFGQQQGITLNVLVQYVWHKLLQVYSKQPYTIVGTTVSGRDLPVAGIADSVGLYINTLPLLLRWEEEMPVLQQLQQLQQKITELNTHSFVPLASLQKQAARIFHSLLAFENYPMPEEDTFSAGFVMRNIVEKLDYPLCIIAYEQGDSLVLKLQYDGRYLLAERAQQHLDTMALLLQQVITQPEVTHHELSLLPPGFAGRVESCWNDPESVYEKTTLVDIALAGMQKAPHKPAVVDASGVYTHENLQDFSYRIAAYLCRHQLAQRNRLIGIFSEKGYQQVAGTLGIMQSGAAYLPLHVEWPLNRIEEVLQEGGVQTLLCSRAAYQRYILGTAIVQQFHCLVIEELLQQPPAIPVSELPVVALQDVAYVIFTSGSTGKPKGVTIAHHSAANTIQSVNKRFYVTDRDKVLALSELSFDLSVYDIFGLLATGGTIVFPDPDKTREPAHWHQLIQQQGITIWNTVPQLMQLLAGHVQEQQGSLSALQVVLLSGDYIPLQLPVQLKEINDRLIIMSLGGATEGSIWSIWYEVEAVDPQWRTIPYGKAMPNQQMFVLDERYQHCAVGLTGEICIGGVGVAMGYWNDAARTAERFIQHPALGRLYRTGDLGKWNRQGYIEFEGRNDSQVKIRGYRVELGEIEQALNAVPGIKQSCVLARERNAGEAASRYIAAWYIPDAEAVLPENDAAILDSWEHLYDNAYEATPAAEAQQADFSGWNSFITEAPLPPEAMEQWRSHIVQRISSLQPQRVLEIGVGTGLLMYPLLPQVQQYTGLDMSLAVISRHRQQLAGMGDKVLFFHARADEVQQITGGALYDTVMLNSVCQYFPGISYLEEVLQQALTRLCPDGTLFIGDIRDYMLHKALIRERLLYKQGFFAQQEVERLAVKENELLVSAAWFLHLEEVYENITVTVLPREGDYCEELCRYRYDVTIQVTGPVVKRAGSRAVPAGCYNIPYLNQLGREAILQQLAAVLPAYMLPATLEAVEAFPLTANGKLDKQALVQREGVMITPEYQAPVSREEILLCGIWQEVLGIPEVGVTDDFFAIGGNSILAIQATQRMNRALETDIKIADLFRHKTIQQLCSHTGCAAQAQSSLVKPYHSGLKPGLPRLILVHPGNSGSEMYQQLADKLVSGFNCIGIDNYNIHHEPKISSLHQLALHYLTLYEKQYPLTGPVYLAGWSLGGQIALEMAAILESRGHQQLQVVLLDTLLGDETLLQLRNAHTSRDILGQMRRLLSIQLDDEYIAKVIAGVDAEVALAADTLSGYLQHTKVVLFKATQPDTRLQVSHNAQVFAHAQTLPANNIDAVARQVEVIHLDCHHYNILDTCSAYLAGFLLAMAAPVPGKSFSIL